MAEPGNPIDLTAQSVTPRKIRMVCLDLDGTVFNSCKQITDPTRAQVRRCLDQGIEVVVVSGRAFHFARRTALRLDKRVSTIGFVGAYRSVRNQNSGAPLTKEALKAILDILEPENCTVYMKELQYIYCNNDQRLRMDYETYTQELGPQGQIHFQGCKNLRDLIEKHRQPIYKVMADTLDRTSAIHEKLLQVPGIRTFVYRYGTIEIISEKADKGIAIQEAAAQLNIPKAEILGIGDSVNDVPMFEACGLRVAMGNAESQLKAEADVITWTNDEDGVARALEALVL